MNYCAALLICVCCVAMAACASSKNEDREQEEVPTGALQPEPIAPGSARVRAEILGYEETPRGYHCHVKILGVDAYGAGAPPLPAGSEIVVLMGSDTLAASEQTLDAREILSIGATITLTIIYRETPVLSGSSSPSWRVAFISSNN